MRVRKNWWETRIAVVCRLTRVLSLFSSFSFKYIILLLLSSSFFLYVSFLLLSIMCFGT